MQFRRLGGTSVPDISLGLGNFDGNGNITSYAFDENNGGTLTTPAQNNHTGTYSVDKISGRVTVNRQRQLPTIPFGTWWHSTAGFVVGTDPNVTAGSFEPQTVSQPITILSLFGNFYGGTSNPVLPSVINEVEAVVATPPPPPGTGNGTFAGTYDTSGTSGVMMNQMFSTQQGPGALPCRHGTPAIPQQATSATGRMLIRGQQRKPRGHPVHRFGEALPEPPAPAPRV